jgi:AcrR family transcriptional regulator
MTGVRRAGRPRSETIDALVLEATLDELAARGFLALSIEAVAARAGVAKTTVYRRWATAGELGVAALRSIQPPAVDAPSGTVRAQLVWLLERMRRQWAEPRYAAIMRRLAADGTADPALYRDGRARLVAPQIRAVNAVLRRALDEGVIRSGTDVEDVRQLLVSPVLAAAFTHRRMSRADLERTVDTVLRGVAQDP